METTMEKQKVTLYMRSEFGMGVKKVEATRLKVEVKPYAQYERGIFVELLPKGKRKLRSFVQAYGPSLLVLEGWGHPDPDGMFLPEEPGNTPGVTVSQGRYSACDPRWQADFDAKIDGYLREREFRPVLHDFRGHQPGARGMNGVCECFSCATEYDATH